MLYVVIGLLVGILIGFVWMKIKAGVSKKLEGFLISIQGFANHQLMTLTSEQFFHEIGKKTEVLYGFVSKWASVVDRQPYNHDAYERSVRIIVKSDSFCKALLEYMAVQPKSHLGFVELPETVSRAFKPGGYTYVYVAPVYGTVWLHIPNNTEGEDSVIVEIHPKHNYSNEWGERFRNIKRVIEEETPNPPGNFESWVRLIA